MKQFDVSGENKNIGDIMTNYEAELLIEVLRAFPIEEYGCKEYIFNKDGTVRMKLFSV